MDRFSKEVRSRIMSKIRSKDTKPEIALRKALWKMGYRYRIHYGRSNIDIAFVSKRVAVFVDGCFWHGCPKHGHMPKSNKRFWKKKLTRNMARDKEYTKELKRNGWKVVRVWEHELENMGRVVRKISKNLD